MNQQWRFFLALNVTTVFIQTEIQENYILLLICIE